MANVRIKLTGKVTTYWLSVFSESGYKFRGTTRKNFDKPLASGKYTLLYHVMGSPGTKFTIKFSNVKSPKSPLAPTIPKKGYTAATKSFEV